MLRDHVQLGASWTSRGGDSVNDRFGGETLNDVLSMAIQTVLLAIVVVSSNRFVKEIIGGSKFLFEDAADQYADSGGLWYNQLKMVK
jgi:hypothetical protein